MTPLDLIRRTLAASLAGLAALALAACASTEPAASVGGAAPAVAIAAATPADTSAVADIDVVTSPGGVTAWLVSEPSIPIISVELAWSGGAAVDPIGKEGLSWLLGYMMNEGAGELDSQAFGERLEDLNTSFGCAVGADWTSCSLTTLSANRDAAFDLAALALAEPRFDTEPVERGRRELLVSIRQAETSPGVIAQRALAEALIPEHAYTRYATAETASAITRDEIRAHQRALMTRDRLLVTVVGDITATELAPLLDQLAAGLAPTSALPDVPDAVPAAARAEPIVRPLPQPQTLVLFSAPGPKRSDPDFYAAQILNYLLGGGGFSSRLMDDIREERGLTYGIGTQLSIQRHLQRWSGSASTRNDAAREVMELTRGHIAALGRDGPTEEEVKDAKAYLTGAYPLAFDSNAKIADQLMAVRRDELGLDFIARRNDLIQAVTMEDLRRVAGKWLKPEAFTFVMVGEPVLEATPGAAGPAAD